MNWRVGIVVAGIGAFVSAAAADVKLPALFGDHMVLQQNQGVPVWGWADPGEKVTVTAGGESETATADGQGNWKVLLGKLPPSAKPIDVTVAGKNTITLHDVLVGDVWLCSGQSNMEFGIGNDGRSKQTIAGADNPEIRLFLVTKKVSLAPQKDVSESKNPLEGHWVVCTPDNIIKVGGWNGFSAVGYYFGKEIQDFTKQPVGLIGSYWGGTDVESWTSRKGLEKTPAGREKLKHVDAVINDRAGTQKKYNAELAKWQVKDDEWKKKEGPKRDEQLKNWWQQVEAAHKKGEQGPPWPQSDEPQKPLNPAEDPNLATMLNDGMIAPLQPYAIKGVIWYQGEQNAWEPVAYRTLFPGLIRDWRAKWAEGDFPFLFVQLAGFMDRSDQPQESDWAALREAQAMALKLPATGMATAVDIGNPHDIHPTDKTDVGHRLALAAEHIAYGANVPYAGPTYQLVQVEDGKIVVTFDHVGGGLQIGRPPEAFGPSDVPTDKVVGFALAGEDHVFHWANAQIDGDKVILTCPEVPSPLAVRYGWANSPVMNLYSKDGLPALPFRTDDWPVGEQRWGMK